jgi:hypothetical protein
MSAYYVRSLDWNQGRNGKKKIKLSLPFGGYSRRDGMTFSFPTGCLKQQQAFAQVINSNAENRKQDARRLIYHIT